MKLSQTNRVYIGFAVLFLLSVTIGVTDFFTIKKQERISNALNHTYQVLNATENVQNIIIDMETGRRGYRLTYQKKYLEPYSRAVDSIGPALLKLQSLVAGDTLQMRNTAILENSVTNVILFWSRLKTDEHKYDSAEIAKITSEEKSRMDEIRAETKNILNTEKISLKLNEAENNKIIAYTSLYSNIGTALEQSFILTLIYLVITELKKRKKAEVELQKAIAVEKQLNELKSRFITMASHEFRTPLAAIKASTYLAAKYPLQEDQLKREKHFERITSSVNSLTNILEELLNVDKLDLGKIEVKAKEFNIEEYIKTWTSDIDAFLKQGQNIIYEHNGAYTVYLDPFLLKHIITNLLSNAIKFSNENATINVTSYHNGKQLMISVKDRGIGIPRDDMNRLFERFHRATNVSAIEGTGVGLHITARYTTLMNGTIKCISDEGIGTEFVLSFPAPINSTIPPTI